MLVKKIIKRVLGDPQAKTVKRMKKRTRDVNVLRTKVQKAHRQTAQRLH